MPASEEQLVSLSEYSLDDIGVEQKRVSDDLQKYADYLHSAADIPEEKKWIALKVIDVILSILAGKAYVSGCLGAFPDRPAVAYTTAFCSAVTSILPTLWTGFGVINSGKPDVSSEAKFLALVKDKRYYIDLIWPSFWGALAATPFALLTLSTAQPSTGRMIFPILWTINAYFVNATLTVFAMQNVTKKVPKKLTLLKEDADIAYKVRAVFLKRLKAQGSRVARGEIGDNFTVNDLLRQTDPVKDPRWLGSTIFSGTGVGIGLCGSVGYASLAFSFINKAFTIPIETVDVITKVVLTSATMVPFTWLFLNGANEVFSGIYAIVESLYDGHFAELLAKNPAYQFYPKAAVIGAITLMTMAALSGVTNEDMTRELAPAFFEKISFGTVHLSAAGADFFGAAAYFTSAMFNGDGSIFGAYFPSLVALAYYLSGNKQKHAQKLNAFNSLVATSNKMSREDSALVINSLEPATKESILDEADKNLKPDRWQTLVHNIEDGFTEKRDKDLEKGLQSVLSIDFEEDGAVTSLSTGSINSTYSAYDAQNTNVPEKIMLLPSDSPGERKKVGQRYGAFFSSPQSTVEELEDSASCGMCAVM